MRAFISRLDGRLRGWALRLSESFVCEGINIADTRHRSPHFRETVTAALALIKAIDSCRFARVVRRLRWIANYPVPHAYAEYHHDHRACHIDFAEPAPDSDRELAIASCACTLIHEATHGVIAGRGLTYTPALRSRMEKICVGQEQRFLLRLTITKPDLATRLYHEFDPALWEPAWNATRLERLAECFRLLRGL